MIAKGFSPVLRTVRSGIFATGAILLFVGILPAADTTGASSASAPATFAKDVFPILEAKCNECHHPGTAAPMSLTNYQEARPWAKSIKQEVVRRNMPPWHLDKNVGIQSFINDRSLSDDQIATLVRWVDAGAPEGDKKDMQTPIAWQVGNDWNTVAELHRPPDSVISSPDFTMPAHGQDLWWKPVSNLNVTEERWVRAVEIRPGHVTSRPMMHHVRADLIAVDNDNQRAGALMEWAIGKNNDVYREGAGKLLEPGATIRWELHAHSIGKEITDHIEIGIWYYPKGEVPTHKTQLQGFQATDNGVLDIAPNAISETSHITVLRSAARLENFQPHMHLRGKAMLMEAILPDGTTRTLSYVDKFNFNWMINYIYSDEAAPVLPKGTMIKVTAWYDNTDNNKGNPDPTKWVGYGDRTVDEMGHAWVNVTNLTDAEYTDWAAAHKDSQYVVKAGGGNRRGGPATADPVN
jgi:hypothetical protein